MSTATLNAPQTNGSAEAPRSRRAPATPRSMVPAQNDAAVSTPKDVDYEAVVKEIMLVQTKNAVGTTKIVSHKGKQHIFALACAAIRSHNSEWAKTVPTEVLVDGKVVVREMPARLPDAIANKIRDAIEAVWKATLLKFLTFGGSVVQSDIRVTENAPVTKVIAADKSGIKDAAGNAICDLDVRLKLQAVVTRPPVNTQEGVLVATMGLERAVKRHRFMLDNPGKGYSGDEVREAEKAITVHEWKILQLKDLVALEKRQAVAIEELDKVLEAGNITQDEYAAKRKEIESSVK